MKPTTKVWLLCESIGKPDATLKFHGTVREAMKAQAEWLIGVYMGAKIRITYAREESDLGADRRSATRDEIMADLDMVLVGTMNGESDESEPE